MLSDDEQTHYEILEVQPDSSPQEIREAYLRLKSAYSKDSVALYTLMTREDTEQMLRRIEEAYGVLSNVEKRRDYDRNHGFTDPSRRVEEPVRAQQGRKIISIDRVPPMETLSPDEDPLVAPRTDFEVASSAEPRAAAPQPAVASAPQAAPAASAAPAAPAPRAEPRAAEIAPPVSPGPALASMRPRDSDGAEAEIRRILEENGDWRGPIFRRIRELKNFSLEEMAEHTKITKRYIKAIEEEDFSSLPAAVYLRGFVVQIAKILRIPPEKAATSYISRYRKTLPERE